MNYYTKKQLISTLQGLSNYYELTSENASLIISEYGGRPLGIFPRKGIISLFWINPELKSIIKKQASGIGGDRYWLSPERNFFYKNLSKWEGWFCPTGLDLANYEIRERASKRCMLFTPPLNN
jgi:hypothetical protein